MNHQSVIVIDLKKKKKINAREKPLTARYRELIRIQKFFFPSFFSLLFFKEKDLEKLRGWLG